MNLANGTNKKNNLSAHISLFITVTIFASTFINIKIVLEQIPPNTAAFLRFFIASLVLGSYFLLTRQKAIGKEDLIWAAFTGLTGVCLYNFIQNQGLKYAGATDAAILASMAPVFMVLLACFVLKEKIALSQLAGIALAFLGSVIVATNGSLSGFVLDKNRLWGDLLILFTGLIWALYNLGLKKLLERYTPIVVLTYSTVTGTIFLLPLVFIEKPSLGSLAPLTWFNLLYLGLFASTLAYFLWNSALNKLSTTAAGSYLYLIPVLTAIIAAIFLDEVLTVYLVAGGILVLAGTYFASR